MIVFGEITEDLQTAVAPLKNRNIQVFVLAVGVNTPSSRHLSIASSRNHVHTVDSVDKLVSKSARLVKDTCKGKLRIRVCSMYRPFLIIITI